MDRNLIMAGNAFTQNLADNPLEKLVDAEGMIRNSTKINSVILNRINGHLDKKPLVYKIQRN